MWIPLTSVLTRATRRNNPEDTILHSHRHENLKSYRVKIVPISPILVTLIMEARRSSETSVHKRVTRHNILEYCILHFFPSYMGFRTLDEVLEPCATEAYEPPSEPSRYHRDYCMITETCTNGNRRKSLIS
jgi:hypothetical protein